MDDLDVILTVNVSEGIKSFNIYSGKDKITIEEIKRKIKDEFNYSEKEMNNNNLLYKDEENDINILTNNDELIYSAKEIEPAKYLINLEIKFKKIVYEDNNKINNEKLEMNKIGNDEKGKDNYDNNVEDEKNKIIK